MKQLIYSTSVAEGAYKITDGVSDILRTHDMGIRKNNSLEVELFSSITNLRLSELSVNTVCPVWKSVGDFDCVKNCL